MTGGSAGRSGVVFQGREWVVLLRGVVAIAFAVAAFTWPSMTQAKLENLFGVYALSHGLLSLVGAIGGRGRPGCVLLATEGAVGLWAGLFSFKSLPTPFASIVFIWLWAAVTGILQLVEAVRLRKEISGDALFRMDCLAAALHRPDRPGCNHRRVRSGMGCIRASARQGTALPEARPTRRWSLAVRAFLDLWRGIDKKGGPPGGRCRPNSGCWR